MRRRIRRVTGKAGHCAEQPCAGCGDLPKLQGRARCRGALFLCGVCCAGSAAGTKGRGCGGTGQGHGHAGTNGFLQQVRAGAQERARCRGALFLCGVCCAGSAAGTKGRGRGAQARARCKGAGTGIQRAFCGRRGQGRGRTMDFCGRRGHGHTAGLFAAGAGTGIQRAFFAAGAGHGRTAGPRGGALRLTLGLAHTLAPGGFFSPAAKK